MTLRTVDTDILILGSGGSQRFTPRKPRRISM